MAFFGFGKPQNTQQDLDSAKHKTNELVTMYMDTLVKKRTKGIMISGSGFVDATRWNNDAQKFMNKTIVPHLTGEEGNAIVAYGLSKFATDFIEKPVQKETLRRDWHNSSERIVNQKNQAITSMTPIQYEEHCAKLITLQGWKCEPTKYTGDQGADVVAKKNGKVLVVQCKLYSSSVGNAAVQEVIAAKSFYRAHHAAVVTNSTYTKSAIALANSAGVILMNHDEIAEIDRRIKLII